MTILDVQFESSEGTAHITPGSGEKFLLCDGVDGESKNVIIMDRVVGSITYFRNNIHDVSNRGKVLKESQFGDQLSRNVLIDASNDSLKLEVECGKKSAGLNFHAEVTCKYNSSEKEVIRVSPGESIRLPDSNKINGDKNKLQSIDIDIKGMELQKCRLSVFLDGSDPTRSSKESDTREEYDFNGDTDDNNEELDNEQSSENQFKNMAEDIASGDNYDEAISRLTHYEEDNKVLLAGEVIDVLENDTQIPELAEELEDTGGEQKLSSALVTHLVREFITKSDNVNDLIFSIDSSKLRSNMMVYDEPYPDQPLSHFVADLKDAEERQEPVDIPRYCGLRKAVQENLSKVKIDSGGEPEDVEFESEESGGVSMDSDMTPDNLESGSDQPAAATPGAQAEMSGNQSDQMPSQSDRTGMTPPEDIARDLSEARSLEEAVMSLNMKALYKIEVPDGVDADRDKNEYTTNKIVEVLEMERRRPTGQNLSKLDHMKKLDKNLLPAVRSVIVSQAISKSSTGMMSGVLTKGALSQVRDDLRGLNIDSGDKIAAMDSNYQVDTIQFSTISSFISEIEKAVEQDGNVQSALEAIPVDGGIREEITDIEVNSQGERVSDF